MNAYGQHVGGGPRPWQLDVLERLVEKGVLRYCDVCGRPFRPNRPKSLYCSFACRQEANRYRARQAKRKERAARKRHVEAVIGR